MSTKTIRATDLFKTFGSGDVQLIDVRTPAEFGAAHAEGATLHPLTTLDATKISPVRPVYLICQTGTRARTAAEKLESAGVSDVIVVEGGTQAWEAAGLPVVRGKKALSLERQVRIAAGSLVVIGTALGAFLHPGFYGLSAFVGAGLVFAGVTDTCGMAMVLARAPWNQVKTSQPPFVTSSAT